MSKRKRDQKKQENLNSPKRRAKRAKKELYKSQAGTDKWEKKKQQRRADRAGKQQQADARKKAEIPAGCRLFSWEKPGEIWCIYHCELKCPYRYK